MFKPPRIIQTKSTEKETKDDTWGSISEIAVSLRAMKVKLLLT